MALSTKVGTFLAVDGVAGTTQAITGVGFLPKAIIFWWSGSSSPTDDTQNGQDSRFGMGYAVSATDRGCHGSYIEDNVATTQTEVSIRSDACIVQSSAGGAAPEGLWDLQSMDADGFTIVVDLDPPAAASRRISYLAIGGADVSSVKGGNFTKAAATGNQAVTGVGFQPDITFFFATGEAGPLPADNDFNARYGFGAAISAAKQGVLWSWAEDGNANTNDQRYSRFDECMYIENNVSAQQRATFVTQDSDGFTVNWLAGTTAVPILYLCIKGGSWHIGNSATLTSLASIATTGYGFAPKAVMVLSVGATAQQTAGTPASDHCLSVGAGTGAAARVAQSNYEQTALATSDAWFGIEYDEIYSNLSLPGIAGLMDIQSMDADGVTFVMDDADPTTRVFWYIGMGDSPAGGPPGPNALMLLGVGR